MMKKILLLFLLSVATLNASWMDESQNGWFWYRETFLDEEPEEEPVPPTSASQSGPLEELERVRKSLDEARAKALLHPNQENVGTYIREQKRWVDQSSIFAYEWKRYVLAHPEVDESLKSPVSEYGAQVQAQLNKEQKIQLIASLRERYGLFFFYQSSCKYSQAFSLVVRAFQERYGWEVIAVSIDGEVLETFPESREDNGLSVRLGIDRVPCLFMVDPSNEEMVPIAYGAIGLDQIEDNIILQFGNLQSKEDRF